MPRGHLIDLMQIKFNNFTHWKIENSSAEKDLWVLVHERVDLSQQSICICSPESQPHPELHQKKMWPTSLWEVINSLHSCETPPGILNPALMSSAQE